MPYKQYFGPFFVRKSLILLLKIINIIDRRHKPHEFLSPVQILTRAKYRPRVAFITKITKHIMMIMLQLVVV
ncbi:hypothetical protein BpHYR1_041029 [Brachionus plicatilis]|uniref:Uncharacterized protein n=1 Tax=Brachionus plicatilis TaxID=10195 RepID=A0A3M7T0R6_BRAPC|nr:hypothetical protein BpHYR1_041029 [Brachionus plicatilis]